VRLPGGRASQDVAVLVDDYRIRPPESFNTAGDLSDLLGAMGSRIRGVFDKFGDDPVDYLEAIYLGMG
jgi:hypothetical protein